MEAPATNRLPNTLGYVYDEEDSYTRFEDEEARAMVSAAYNSAQSYAVGDLCIYNNKLWKATKATSGTWDATAWKETTLAEVNAGMRSDITNLTEKTKNVDRCVRYVNNAWGTSLFVPYGETVNGYVKISAELVFLVWVGGDILQHRRIYGTEENEKTVSFSFDKNSGMTVTTTSTQGILYIGM